MNDESNECARLGGSSLSEKVYEELEAGILSNRYKPGESLIELKLSAELGVSRTPVREAIRMLEQKGLVEAVPHRGAVVLGITEKDLEDIYTIRMYIEGLAARWAAERITPGQLQELREIVELQEFYYLKKAPVRLNGLDSDFHEKLYEYSGSRTLRHILSQLHHMILRFRALSFAAEGRAEKSIEEHRQILDALAKGDGVRAEGLAVRHIEYARKNLFKVIQTQKQEGSESHGN